MIVKTMKGKMLDMGALIAKNSAKMAVGNARMNARGDILDKNGQVVKKREDTTQEYYQNNPNAVKQVALKDISSEVFVTPAEAAANMKHANAVPKKRKIEEKEV